MKQKSLVLVLALVLVFVLGASAASLGTAFSYQGRLTDGGNPANGTYDVRFILYNADAGGSQIGVTVTNEDVTVSGGLFTTTIDFSSVVFTNEARWLEISVRPGTNTGAFTPLNPRQPLTPAPYALFAPSAQSAATATTADGVPWSGITGKPAGLDDGDNDTIYTAGAGLNLTGAQFSVSFGGSGAAGTASRSDHVHSGADITSGVVAEPRIDAAIARDSEILPAVLANDGAGSGLDADLWDGLDSAAFWRLGGNNLINPNTQFLGTTNNQSVEFRVNNARVLLLQPTTNAPNVIAGDSVNSVPFGTYGATISGGGSPFFTNLVAANHGTVGGGRGNEIHAGASWSTIAGGIANAILADATHSTIGGGQQNLIQTNATRSTISGGVQNSVQAGAGFSTIAGGSFNIISDNSNGAAIGGGQQNLIHTNSSDSTIGGGNRNTVQGSAGNSTIAGGTLNIVVGNSTAATIGGGSQNTNAGNYATIPGGFRNAALADFSFAAGNRAKANHSGSFVWADQVLIDFSSTAVNQFSVRANGGARFVTGGAGMTVDGSSVLAGTVSTTQLADGATLAEIADDDGPGSGLDADLVDGLNSTAFWKLAGNTGTTPGTDFLGTVDNQPLEVRVNNARVLRLEPTAVSPNIIAGFDANFVSGAVVGATIAGGGSSGFTNSVAADYSTIGGGRQNAILTNASRSTIAGGAGNNILSDSLYSTIGGGRFNTIQTNAIRATVAGGEGNTIQANSLQATISGGEGNMVLTNSGAATISGGFQNRAKGVSSVVAGGQQNAAIEFYASVGGGFANAASGPGSVIGGGTYNIVSNFYATVSGGQSNVAGGDFSFAAGRQAKALHPGAFVWADSIGTDFASSAINQFSVRAGGGVRLVTGGAGLTVDGAAVLSGTVGEAQLTDGATLAELSDDDGSGSGLDADLLDGLDSTAFWKLNGNSGTTPGTHFLGTADSQVLELKVNNSRALRLEPGTSPNVIGGFSGNLVAPGVVGAVIGGGGTNGFINQVTANHGTIGGGWANTNAGMNSTVGGGLNNSILTNTAAATIGGGAANFILTNSPFSTIGGGAQHRIQPNSTASTIGGGLNNAIQSNSADSTIGGGQLNRIEADSIRATIAGGSSSVIGTNSANSTIGGGNSHTVEANAANATIAGGSGNVITSNATGATIPGGALARARNYGQLAYASGGFGGASGNAQASQFVLRTTTANAVLTELFLDGSALRMVVPTNGVWSFDVLIVASGAAGASAGYQVRGVIENDGGTTALVGAVTETVLAEDDAAWDVTVSADDISDSLRVRVNGDAADSVRWVASVRTVEVIN